MLRNDFPDPFSPKGESSSDVPSPTGNNGTQASEPDPDSEGRSRLLAIWEELSRAGLADAAQRIGTHALLIVLILVVAWLMRQFYRAGQAESQPSQAVLAASLPTPTPTAAPPNLPPFLADRSMENGITRFAYLHTSIPARPRTDVITYTVETGDTLFGIAEEFGLKPETLLWGNQLILADNPHNLQPEQELNILPVDGTYYRWSAGDGLNGVADFFGLTENHELFRLSAELEELKYITTKETPGGYHVHFDQYIGEYPVLNSRVNVTISGDNRVIFVTNGSKINYNMKVVTDLEKIIISSEQALISAKNYLGLSGSVAFEKSEPGIYYKQGTFRLAQVVTIIPAEELFGQWEILVDAQTGEIFRVEDKACYFHPQVDNPLFVNGTGYLFFRFSVAGFRQWPILTQH